MLKCKNNCPFYELKNFESSLKSFKIRISNPKGLFSYEAKFLSAKVMTSAKSENK